MNKDKKYILIWGSYTEGNYGDDLMCLMISLKLKEYSIPLVVYGLSDDLCKKYGLIKAFNLEETVKQSRFCVIGGGAYLQENSSPFYKKLSDLLKLTSLYAVPVLPLSIGGDLALEDISKIKTNNPYKLFITSKNICSLTVRTTADFDYCKNFIPNVAYFPDIVLSSCNFIKTDDITSETNQSKCIFLHVKNNKINLALFCIFSILATLKGYKVCFLKSHLQSSVYNNNDLTLPFFRKLIYTDPFDFASRISQCSILISHKLHLGVTALSFHRPFISFQGSNKTRLFMNENHLGCFFIKSLHFYKLFFFLVQPYQKVSRTFHNKYENAHLSDLIFKSYSHFNYLEENIEK